MKKTSQETLQYFKDYNKNNRTVIQIAIYDKNAKLFLRALKICAAKDGLTISKWFYKLIYKEPGFKETVKELKR